jgi:outer membrane protein TolC
MRIRTIHLYHVAGLWLLLVAGCAAVPGSHSADKDPRPFDSGNDRTVPKRSLADVVPVAAKSDVAGDASSPVRQRPAYAKLETLPIDLPTVIRLTDEKNPAIGFARARAEEAEARLAGTEVLWIPNLSIGTTYNRFDGQTQNQRGDVFNVSRANLFGGGGAALTLDIADAIYRPLIERRSASAERDRSQAAVLGAELESVQAYLDLVQLYAQLEINRATLAKTEAILKLAKEAKEAKTDRNAGDVHRSQTEALLRRTEGIELEGRIGQASARLGRLLLLEPHVKLVPAERTLVPITLIEPETTLDALVQTALQNRPDLAAARESIAAAWERVRRAEVSPLVPKLVVQNQTGAYGGGLNDDLQNFQARNALGAQLFWEVRNLGFGNRAEIAERKAGLEQSHFQLIEVRARMASDIVESAQVAAARFESLDLAERSVKEATELYRISKEGIANVVDAKNLFDALRPLQAIQVLNQSQLSYANAVAEYNKAQYRLFVQLGCPVSQAIPQMP